MRKIWFRLILAALVAFVTCTVVSSAFAQSPPLTGGVQCADPVALRETKQKLATAEAELAGLRAAGKADPTLTAEVERLKKENERLTALAANCGQSTTPVVAQPRLVLVCGEGTVESKVKGIKQCDCLHPDHMFPLPDLITGGKRIKRCTMTDKGVHDADAALQSALDEIATRIGKADSEDSEELYSIIQQLRRLRAVARDHRGDVADLVRRIEALEAQVDELLKLKSRVDRLEQRSLELHLGGGVGFEMRGDSGSGFDAGASVCIAGFVSGPFGLVACGDGGIYTSDTTGTIGRATARAGLMFGLSDDRRHRLLAEAMCEQDIRGQPSTRNTDGNGMGWGCGGRISSFHLLGDAPFALEPNAYLLGGQVGYYENGDDDLPMSAHGSGAVRFGLGLKGYFVAGLVGSD